MINSKYIRNIVAVCVCLAFLFSAFIVLRADSAEAAEPEYQKRLFSGEIVSIDIQVDEADWQSLVDNAMSKEYISADLVINGDRFPTVGIRTKGNTSLSMVTNERYSLQLNPNYYVSGQSFYGLDSACLNNLTADTTYMKDYISYEIMDYLDVPSPLHSYANVTINGEPHGLFLLLERYDDSFLDRVYNSTTGELYNVKMQMGERSQFEAGEWEPERGRGGAEGENPQVPDFDNMPPEGIGEAEPGQPRQGGMGGMGGMFSSGGGSLVYTDDEASSYGSIFNNAVSNKVSENDQKQVITAIKELNEGDDIEEYWDVDEILRYLAAHTFVVNLDSYVSSMQQNYYLLERDGVISILPWDYNLAFGGFNSRDADAVINFPIDTPVSGVQMEDRPLVSQILAVDEYRERYHGYLNDIVEGYVNSGLFEQEVDRVDEMISQYVQSDATALYTFEEHEDGLETLRQVVSLRAKSVAGQLDGSIASTTEGQADDTSSLISAGGLDLSAMGSMGGGGMGSMGGGGMGDGGGFGNMDNEGGFGRPGSPGDEEQPRGGFRGNGGFNAPEGMAGGFEQQNTTLGTTDWVVLGVMGVLLIAAIVFMAAFKRRRWNAI